MREGDGLVGHNTDGAGFLAALRGRRDPAGARAALTVVNRGAARGRELERVLADLGPELRVVALGDGYRVPADTDLVVNGTSIGLYPDSARRCRST